MLKAAGCKGVAAQRVAALQSGAGSWDLGPSGVGGLDTVVMSTPGRDRSVRGPLCAGTGGRVKGEIAPAGARFNKENLVLGKGETAPESSRVPRLRPQVRVAQAALLPVWCPGEGSGASSGGCARAAQGAEALGGWWWWLFPLGRVCAGGDPRTHFCRTGCS